MDEGIWDDGEFVSWDEINGYLAEQELREAYPHANLRVVHIFEDLVQSAWQYKEATGKYLQIWGELGEVFAEIAFGLVRHKAHTPGSDGRLGNDWIEVKTISPEKGSDEIAVKRAGNFNKLIVVKISLDFEFKAQVVERKTLAKGPGKFARYKWTPSAPGSTELRWPLED